MSKETVAAILTQVYFQSSPTASHSLNRQVDADPGKGVAPADGAIAAIVQTYAKTLDMLDKLGAPKR